MQIMCKKDLVKKLVLFLGLKTEHKACYDEIGLNFDSNDELIQVITDSLNDGFVEKSGSVTYRLTEKGLDMILSMDKNQKFKLLRGLLLFKTMNCPICTNAITGLVQIYSHKTRIQCKQCDWKSW